MTDNDFRRLAYLLGAENLALLNDDGRWMFSKMRDDGTDGGARWGNGPDDIVSRNVDLSAAVHAAYLRLGVSLDVFPRGAS